MMSGMEEVEVVVAHRERATLRVGDVFLKVDPDQARVDAELEAMAVVPVPTATVLWRNHPVLALAALPGVALDPLESPTTAPAAAWEAAGAQDTPSTGRGGRVRQREQRPPPPLDGGAVRMRGPAPRISSQGEDVRVAEVRPARGAMGPWAPAQIRLGARAVSA